MPEAPSVRSRTSGRPNRATAAALPTTILDAAQELFLAQGYERTTLEQIAGNAGVTKRTLYVKVGDKAELLTAVVARLLGHGQSRLVDVGPGRPVERRLEAFGTSLLDVALDLDMVRLHRLMLGAAEKFPELTRLMGDELAGAGNAGLAELLADEDRAGRLAVPDPDRTARMLSAMIVGEPQREALFGLSAWSAAERNAWVRSAIDLFLQSQRIVSAAQ
jgi:AcrR family transcriptional regulator